jgi:DMSO/TMAO reductase YedYZ molybdopterin-dependent catalytic subunit
MATRLDQAASRSSGGPSGWAAAVCGVAAAAAGLAVAQGVALLTGAGSAPVIAVGDAFVDRVPPAVKDAAVSLFGTADKAVLLVGAWLVVLGLAALAGYLEARRPPAGAWLVLALGAVAALAAATRPDAGPLAVAPSVAAALVGVGVLRALLRREVALRSFGTGEGDAGATRRALLAAPLLVLAGASAALAGVGFLGQRVRRGEASRDVVRLPDPTSPAPALPEDVEVGVAGVAPFRVPNPDFYRIDTALVVPQVSAAGWSLRVFGMVDQEITLDYAELLAGGLVERDVTLTCVSNEVGGDLIGNAVWLGLPVAPLLARARPAPDADMVLSTSVDGWTCSTPLEVLTDGRDALLAVGMNGEPLPTEHGFPVRMVVPGLYGYVSATKWVVSLEVTRFDRDQGYWTPRGWSERGPVKTSSRIDVPRAGARVSAGRVAVAGVAWAQHRGIRGVQVRVDDGDWQPCDLGGEASADTWRQWVYRWDAAPGTHVLQVRARDGDGDVQSGQQAPPAPDGATGWHTITVEVA